MSLNITGRQLDVTQDLRHFAEKRLMKLPGPLRHRSDIHVILSAEKHRRTAEITLKFRDQTMVSVEETADARSSIIGAVEKLKRQAMRFLEKRRTGKRRAKPTSAVQVNVLVSGREDHEGRQILESERMPIEFLTIEEAAVSADFAHRGLVVFRNIETDRVNVLYRRQDGNLGLIEPVS